MTSYRFYFLDRKNHIVCARDSNHVADSDAMEHATELSVTHNVEVWQEARCVGQVGKQRHAQSA